jgi:hypothetical protein
MSQTEQNETAAKSSRAVKFKWMAVVFFVLLAVVGVMNLPRGYSDDLSRIGKGKAAVVLIRDKNAVQTFDLMEVLNEIRDQHAAQVEFLLTDFNTPQGRAFIAANGASRVTLVVLDANGKLVSVLYPPQTAKSVQQEITKALRMAQ